MEEKKCGILTFHRARNIGADLQAYALQTYIESQGERVEIINYSPKYIEDSFGIVPKNLLRQIDTGRLAKIKCLLKLLLKFPYTCMREYKFARYRRKYYHLSGRKTNKYEEVSKKANEYKVIFCGSDQIWNPMLTNHLDRVYFGDIGTNKIYKVSYAASIGQLEMISSDEEKFKKLVHNLDRIGVRETSAKEYLNKLNITSVEVNVDPTLLLSRRQWEKIMKEIKISYKYIFVYALEINEKLIEVTKLLAKKTGLQIIFLDMKNRYGKGAHSKYTTDPNEFLGYVKNAEYVVTNSFHGTVFSIIFQKNFFVIPHKTKNNRIENLLENLELTYRIVEGEPEQVDYEKEIDYVKTEYRLEKAVVDSKNYIKQALERV